MKKNLLTKILACSMALAMFTGAGMTVSAVETELGGLSHIISENIQRDSKHFSMKRGAWNFSKMTNITIG